MLYTNVMKIKDKLKADRPREKLACYGAERLSDLELLMAIIGSGNAKADVGVIARRVLRLLQEKDGELVYSDLRSVVGLGEAKIPVILASLELAKRYLVDSDRPVVDSPEKAVVLLANIRDKKQEHFVCLTLDGANRLIVAHNHPSGSLEISQADRDVTNRLAEAGKLLGITLIDHIVVTKSKYRSIVGQG